MIYSQGDPSKMKLSDVSTTMERMSWERVQPGSFSGQAHQHLGDTEFSTQHSESLLKSRRPDPHPHWPLEI
ncbi:hypothetical protein ILYODFUR_035680 [Ilyodon furcidens]|uniref:Uncharacterized protein n=1 Tax=Ilyodon furcidens TaxID=33524 RepID=A0ABV0SRV6_9TELE